MKFAIIFTLVLATVSAFDLRKDVGKNFGRITNGNYASDGQFPYQVGLSFYINETHSSWCGGCLIGTEWILTAAHCTIDRNSATVYLGATNRLEAEVTYTVSMSNFIIHSDYNRHTFANDISLIRIPSVSLTSRIQLVKLPSIHASSYSSYAGDYVVASGWGRISDDVEFVTDDLQWARLQVIDNNACRRIFLFLTASSMCVATPGGMSTCDGDSGGPLVLVSSGELIGVTSFGHITGCSKGYPAAYARVSNFLDWIQLNTGISY